MATPAQIVANRRNAARSTGPRTPAGKAAASRNALRHGLTAQSPLLPSEDSAAYQLHLDRFRAEWQPLGPTEESLVRRMAEADWALQRVPALEAALFDFHARIHYIPKKLRWHFAANPVVWAFHGDSAGYNDVSKLARYAGHLERKFNAALRELRLLRAGRLSAARENQKCETKPIPRITPSESAPASHIDAARNPPDRIPWPSISQNSGSPSVTPGAA